MKYKFLTKDQMIDELVGLVENWDISTLIECVQHHEYDWLTKLSDAEIEAEFNCHFEHDLEPDESFKIPTTATEKVLYGEREENYDKDT